MECKLWKGASQGGQQFARAQQWPPVKALHSTAQQCIVLVGFRNTYLLTEVPQSRYDELDPQQTKSESGSGLHNCAHGHKS